MRAALLARPRIQLRVPSLSSRLRRRTLVLAVAAVALAAGYLFWFRDSSLVRVEQVAVSGMTTNQAPQVRQALTAAAHGMTTLHVDRDRLNRVATAYPAVHSIEVSTGFPHALRIRVIEERPVAVVGSGRQRVGLSGDGAVLRGVPVEHALPVMHLRDVPPEGRIDDRSALVALRVFGTAPAALLPRVIGVSRERGRGLVVHFRHGPDLVFGSARRLRAKWTAAARVLADPAARGAAYLDVRLPERPAAGGVGAPTVSPVAPAQQPPQAAPVTPQQTTPQAATPPRTPGAQAPEQPPTAPTPAAPQQQGPAQTAPPAPATPGGGATVNPQP